MAGVDCRIKRGFIASCDGGTTKRCIVFIPEEIVFNILLYLPADVIYNSMRYVCREWYNIIHSPIFISSHLQKSTSGFFLQRYHCPESGYFVKMRKCAVEVKELNFQFPGIVVASCNGLVLLIDNQRCCIPYIANPVTKQQLALPFLGTLTARNSGFAYAASSRVYKVVHCFSLKYGCAILTVGVDKAWRFIDISQLTSTTVRAFWPTPLSVGGFVHWAHHQVPFVLSLDVETEIFQQIPLPEGCENKYFKFLAMGSSLSFILFRETYLWEIWLLTDPKLGQWQKLPDVNLKGLRHILEDWYNQTEFWLDLLGWLQSGELMLLYVPCPTMNIFYNSKTGRVHLFEVTDINLQQSIFFYHRLISSAHVNSLVPLNSFLLR